MRNPIFRAIALTVFSAILIGTSFAQNLIGVQSTKVHSTAGSYGFAVDYLQPISGLLTIEPRAIGTGHVLVFQFDSLITLPGSATVVDQFGTVLGAAATAATGADNNVQVTLTGVPDNVRALISLSGVNGGTNVSARIGYLFGDVNANLAVTSADVSAVKARTGLAAGPSMYIYDLNASGKTTAADIAGVTAHLNRTFVSPTQSSLGISLAGTGRGTVVSAPAGITCPMTCAAPFSVASMPPPTNISLTAAAATGSNFTGWSGGCSGASVATSVAFTGTTTCVASFAINSYAVTPSTGANGTISPATVQNANHGSTATFTVTPSNGTFVPSVGGTCGGSLVGTTYTTNPLTGPCTVVASFSAITYAVTPSAGANGVITPSTVQNVTSGATRAFTISPNATFTPSVAGTCGGNLVGLTFTTNPVIAPCTVVASFVRNSYTVTPSAGLNGTISPATAQTALNGNTISYTVTPSAGYSAVVGGTCGGTLVGTTYTTNTISGNCSVIATFLSNTPKYVSTTGNDATGNGTIGNPWQTIGKGISSLLGGESLIIRNGTYSGTANFITGVPGGTATRFTTISAESPMQVRIQSTGTLLVNNNQLNLSGNFIKVNGFIFDMSGTINPAFIGDVSGSFNTVSRSIFKRGGDIDAFGGLLAVTGSDNLFEDLAGVGACGICFKQGGPSATTQRNIWRRVVGRFDYSNSTQPKATFATFGSNTVGNVRDHLYQNVIAIDGQNPGNLGGTEKMGGFYASLNTSNISMQGSMVLNEGVGSAGVFLRELGSFNNASHTVVWDMRNSLASAPGLVGGGADRLTVGGVVPGAAVDLITSATASLLKPGVNPTNLLNNTPGAVVLKQYGVSGTRWGETGYDQITAIDLWPWPYQDTIKAVFREVNNVPGGNSPVTNDTLRGFAATGSALYGGPLTLTSYIWEYLGVPCPPTACITYTVTPSAGANGTITPTTLVTALPNETRTFTVTPNSGFNASMGGTCGGTLVGTTYTTFPITSSCTVVANFVLFKTWYISPAGNNASDGLTPGTARKTFANVFAAMSAGDQLILLDGQYTPATTGIIHFNTSLYTNNSAQVKSGVSLAAMTIVRAQNPGNVTINGPLFIGRSTRKDSFIFIQGITFEGGGDLYNTSFNTIKDCGFHGAFSIGTNDHENGNTDNLIEDVWIWASGQRIIASNYQADRNVWRRVVVRGDGCGLAACSGSGNPNVGFTSYDSRDTSTQNVILVDRILIGTDSKYADFATAQHTPTPSKYLGRNDWLGSMSINPPDHGFHFEADATIPVDPTWTLKDVLVIGDGGLDGINIGASGRLVLSNATLITTDQFGDGVRVAPGSPGTSVTNTIVKGFNRGLNSFLKPSYTDTFGSAQLYNQTTPTVGVRTTNPTADGATPSLKYPVRIESGSALKGAGLGGADIGANIINRYGIDGSRFGETNYNTLSASPLWPWPNQDRIKREMCATTSRGFCTTGTRLDGTRQVTLTSYIWEFLGNPVPSAIDP